MPEIIFRFVLPLYAVLALVGLLVRRSLVRRRIGHDPIVIRPLSFLAGRYGEVYVEYAQNTRRF